MADPSAPSDEVNDKKMEDVGEDEEITFNDRGSRDVSDAEKEESGSEDGKSEKDDDDKEDEEKEEDEKEDDKDEKGSSGSDSSADVASSSGSDDEESEDESDGSEGEGKELTERQKQKQAEKAEKQKVRQIQKDHKRQLQQMRDEQNKQVEASKEKSNKDKLKFLLQQTDIYTHFMKSLDVKGDGKKGATNRGSKAEKAEDEILLQQELEETKNKLTYLTTTPSYIKNGTMRDYQIHGLNWLVKLYDNGINGILADEMGLGKTLQTISFLGYLKEIRGVSGPHMVVCPKSTLGNWMNEFAKWCPSLHTLRFHGNKDDRAELRENKLLPGKFDICVTTYEIAIKEKAALKKFSWRYIVIDEAHRIKNENSSLSQIVRMYSSQYRLLITGTPLQNNLHELWALLNFLLPDVFASSSDFDEWFKLEGNDKDAHVEVVQKLHKVLRPFLLRRLKSDVEKSLPPKKEILLFVGMSSMQKEWYTKLLRKDLEVVNSTAKSKSMKVRLLNIIMQLRKCCNHPYLFDGAEPGPPYTTGDHLVFNSGKMVVLDKLLPKLKQQGSRVLIFSQMTRLLDILEDYMLFRGYKYARIDGQTNGEDREESIEAYNKPNSELFAFLLSTRAGGLGINLATADVVILYDSDWNPQVDLQAQDRAHRIGQTKEVKVFRFVTEGTVEEKIIERAEMKLQLDALVIQQGRLVDTNKAMGHDELLSMIKYGADSIFSSKDSTITDEDIDAILNKGEEKTAKLNDKIKDHTKKMIDFSSDGMNIWNFDGVDYSQGGQAGSSSNKKFNSMFWLEPAKRERKMNSYAVDEYYRNALRVTAPKKPGAPRPPRQTVVHDFQFFPSRLHELLDKELASWVARMEAKKQQPDATTPPPSTPPPSTPPPTTEVKKEEEKEKKEEEKKEEVKKEETKKEEVKKEEPKKEEEKKAENGKAEEKGKEAKKEEEEEEKEEKEEGKEDEEEEEEEEGDETEGKDSDKKKRGRKQKGKPEEKVSDLSPEEQQEKEQLLKEGFSEWTRRDFQAFVKGCEKYGRKQYASIAAEIGTKTPQQVKEYSQVFWVRYEEIANFEKYIKAIEKGEGAIQRLEEMKKHLDKKVARYKDPWQQLKIVYTPGAKGKTYIEAEDIFLVCMMHKLGYGEWEQLKMEVRKAWQFRFDWFIKSRTTIELSKRCDVLMRMIEKENQDIEEKERERERQREAERRKKESEKKKASKAKSSPAAKSKAKPKKSPGKKAEKEKEKEKEKEPAKKKAKATKKEKEEKEKEKPAKASSSRKRKDKEEEGEKEKPSKKQKADKE